MCPLHLSCIKCALLLHIWQWQVFLPMVSSSFISSLFWAEQTWDVVPPHSSSMEVPYAGEMSVTSLMSSLSQSDGKAQQQQPNFSATANSWAPSTENWNTQQTPTTAIPDKVCVCGVCECVWEREDLFWILLILAVWLSHEGMTLHGGGCLAMADSKKKKKILS